MGDGYLAYERARFATRLPTDRLFTEAHVWTTVDESPVRRVGLTRFATRMLGDVVELDFEVEPGAVIEVGQAIGWIEGFKAVTDVYAPLAGRFAGANPDLDAVIGDIKSSPYGKGWLFAVEAPVPDDWMTATEYARFLDATIDRMTGRSS